MRAVDLLAGLDCWTALAALLEAACHADPAVAARAHLRIERSKEVNRGHVPQARPGWRGSTRRWPW